MSEGAAIGHNSSISKEAADRLKSIIDRIERLEEERKVLADDVKDIKKEAKSAGYDMSAISAILKMRKKEAQEVLDATMVIETYCRALGMRSYLE